MKKPLRCRLGLHSWYRDSAYFRSVERCNHCPRVDDLKAAKDLEYERWLWEKYSDQGLSFDVTLFKVADDLLSQQANEEGVSNELHG